jgi:leucine dehydrogenase
LIIPCKAAFGHIYAQLAPFRNVIDEKILAGPDILPPSITGRSPMAVTLASGVTPPEKVSFFEDPATGLRSVIVIHSTALGPAAGGCRFWSYADKNDAVADAMRLAEGMTYKNALAGLPFGGGKAVIMRPSGEFDRALLFKAFGRGVDSLDGAYVTAEDVGTLV